MKYLTLLAALVAIVLPPSAQAQKWPERTVRLIVPYPPGGNADVVGRIIAQSLQEALGETFIVDNRPGAGGLIGGEQVAKSAPDGYTLLLSANGPILFAPEIAKRPPYLWRKDFAPISTVSLTPLVLLVNPSVPAKSLREFFDYARRVGNKLAFAAGGTGTINHLFSELIQSRTGLSWTTVQYKGTAPAMNDLIAGHVPFGIDQVSASVPMIRDNRVRALAVSSARRTPLLPEIPTLVELGYNDLEASTFTALMAPAGTPEHVIATLHSTLNTVAKNPVLQEKIQALGAELITMRPLEFRQYLEKEDQKWLPIVRKLNLQSE